jgi:hypothetical protein
LAVLGRNALRIALRVFTIGYTNSTSYSEAGF